jgi:hypothetical protein
MHENREISSMPSSTGEGRSAKAMNRNADMHVLEKSDCVVVPVSHPNKGANALAEGGEGRTQMKENTVQPRMLPTQSGVGMSQGLDGVRKAAKDRKQERFTSLLHHLDVGLLRDSSYALKRRAAPGVDGVRWEEYETGLEDQLIDLHGRVHRGAHRAQPSRRVYIPKANGRQRPLGIAALEDKIVQQAVVSILNQIYEVDFKGFSYGFRPGRSPHQALDALTVGIQRKKVNWISIRNRTHEGLPKQARRLALAIVETEHSVALFAPGPFPNPAAGTGLGDPFHERFRRHDLHARLLRRVGRSTAIETSIAEPKTWPFGAPPPPGSNPHGQRGWRVFGKPVWEKWRIILFGYIWAIWRRKSPVSVLVSVWFRKRCGRMRSCASLAISIN